MSQLSPLEQVADLADRSRSIMQTNPRLVGDAGEHLGDSDED